MKGVLNTIFYIACGILIIGLITFVVNSENKYKNRSQEYLIYKYRVDSLNIILDSTRLDYLETVSKLTNELDGLYNERNKVIVKYETVYKDFIDSTIVDDDSITRYISSKIHSKW